MCVAAPSLSIIVYCLAMLTSQHTHIAQVRAAGRTVLRWVVLHVAVMYTYMHVAPPSYHTDHITVQLLRRRLHSYIPSQVGDDAVLEEDDDCSIVASSSGHESRKRKATEMVVLVD